MVATQTSGTARRFIGVLVLIPIIAAVWSDVKIASIVILILAIGMAHEFSKMLKMPATMLIALTFAFLFYMVFSVLEDEIIIRIILLLIREFSY